MLIIGSLSESAFGLRELLIDKITDFEGDISRIKIGHPGTNLKDLDTQGENGLNLFFYHVDYDGYPADGSNDNPFYVRMYCLITAVGQEIKKNHPDNTEGRDISKGENELRLVGEVMNVLHTSPIVSLVNSDDEEIASLQVVPHAITMDTLNHIWGTQGSETPYRLSMAYEIALAPVPMSMPTEVAPLAGRRHIVSWGAMKRKSDEERTGLIDLTPRVEYLKLDISKEEWMPHIAFVETQQGGDKVLHYVAKIDAPLDVLQEVILAGAEGQPMKLFWNVWRRKNDNSVDSWQNDIADAVTAEMTLLNDPPNDDFQPYLIDPNNIDIRQIADVRLPPVVSESDTKTWQATLYAEREREYEFPQGSGQILTEKIRSNSILLYGGAA